MRSSFIGDIPHKYVWADSGFFMKEPVGFVPAVWFCLVSFPQRMWGCNIMLECGAIYRGLPPHAIAFTQTPKEKVWKPADAQTWDCYGTDFSVLEYTYLSQLGCKARINGRQHLGEYMFTAAPIGDAFSAYPEQAKEFSFIKLVNDRLTVVPTNDVIFREASFTGGAGDMADMDFPRGIRRSTKVYYAEGI